MTIFDGAMGTYYAHLADASRPCEWANVERPDVVAAIHKAYIDAGAEAIKTNTFCRHWPDMQPPAPVDEITRRAWAIANEAARGRDVAVFADIGVMTGKDAAEGYLEAARAFLRLGADKFFFETLDALEPLLPALAELADKGAACYVSFAVSPEGFTRAGLHYRHLIHQAMALEVVAAAGLNCLCGPAHMLELTRRLGKTPKPLIAMPNAGYPENAGGRMAYRDNPEYFAVKTLELRDAGVAILGGCCGTTPRHIQLAAEMLRARGTTRGAAARAEAARQSRGTLPMKRLLVELDPPVGADCSFVLSAAKRLKGAGAAAVTLADSPLGKARADSVLTAARLRTETGMAVLPHLTCRDRNSIAIKASLLGAHMFGIHQVLVVTGDPLADTAGRRSVFFDFNATELIGYINRLNADVFTDAPFQIGGALNVNAVNFAAELERARKKTENGASFLLSQPIFMRGAAENFTRARETLDCELYAGILPVAGYKNALFLSNEVSGIDIPGGMLERLRDATAEDAAEIAVDFCAEIIHSVYDAADGFYIMTPLKKVGLVVSLIERCFAEVSGDV